MLNSLIVENDNELQRRFYMFKRAEESFNIETSSENINKMVIPKEPTRYKLIINDKTIEQVINFIYVEIEILCN